MRVVRSAKDKAWDEMKEKVGKITNALKINDWTIVEGEFDELSKRIEAKKVPWVLGAVDAFHSIQS